MCQSSRRGASRGPFYDQVSSGVPLKRRERDAGPPPLRPPSTALLFHGQKPVGEQRRHHNQNKTLLVLRWVEIHQTKRFRREEDGKQG